MIGYFLIATLALGFFMLLRRVRRRMHLSEEFPIKIVGESHYQDALARICGGANESGHTLFCEASLHPESDNPADSNAVRVEIQGNKVGYLQKMNAKRYRKIFAEDVTKVPAVIRGGWDRGGDRTGMFGVTLKLELPNLSERRR